MPYAWEDPEVAAEANGRTVYYCYTDDDCVMGDIYTTDGSFCNEDNLNDWSFDIYDLTPPPDRSAAQGGDHNALLVHAIETGQLSFPDDPSTW